MTPSDSGVIAGSSGSGEPQRLHRAGRRLAILVLLSAAAATFLPACGDGSEGAPAVTPAPEPADAAAPAPEPADPPAPAPEPADAPAPAPEPADPPAPAPEPADPLPTDPTGPPESATGLAIEIAADTAWQEVFDTLAAPEQACIRDAMGDETLRLLLDQRVADSDLEQDEMSLFACVAPSVAESLFLNVMLAGVQQEGMELSDDEEACLRERLKGIDWEAVAIAADGDGAAFGALMSGVVRCMQDFVLAAMLAEMQVDLDGLDDDERECLRRLMDGIDWGVLFADDEDPDGFVAFAAGLFGCLPEVLLAVMLEEMGIEPDELSDEERSCLRELISEFDLTAFTTLGDDPEAFAALALGLLGCYSDDYSVGADEAIPATVGEPVQGVLDDGGDRDFFVFRAEQDQLYRIDIELGTLGDSIATLYDADQMLLAYNDDSADSLASRIVWMAPSSGDYYVEVSGYDTGSYTLTVAKSDIADDHANAAQRATVATVGEAIHGVLDYEGDRDFFVFRAEQDQSYRIDIELGTLSDSVETLYDADQTPLVENDDANDDSLAPRISWTAPSSGDYYVAVSGYDDDTGSYTLTVATSDITDDHANTARGATVATLGEAMHGVLDYYGDYDFFVFRAEQDQSYRIDVELGTLGDSIATLYDADRAQLAKNDDANEDSLASRISWTAPRSGDYYVEVSGYDYGTGSYTLSVSKSEAAE